MAFDLPSDLGFPRVCPTCGGTWQAFGIDLPSTAYVMCSQWHQDHQQLDAVEMLIFELAVVPQIFTARPMWIVGDNHPVSTDPMLRLGAEDAVPGRSIQIDQVAYEVAHVELDRVWLRPAS